MTEFNPFEAPAEDSRTFETAPDGFTQLLKKFRQQITALGAVWIFFGGVGMVASGVMLMRSQTVQSNEDVGFVFGIVVAIISIVWFGLGIATCLKQMWAVYLGLGISYLSLLGNLTSLNICGLVIVVLVIIQGHRVIGYSKTLLAASIPLNSKP